MKKQFTLHIYMDSPAFDDDADGKTELYNILEKLQNALPMMEAKPGEWGIIHTSNNGKPVGQWHFKRTRKG